MKSSKIPGKFKRKPDFLLMILAICIAIGMWYVVSVRDQLEKQIDVNIDYTGIPQNLVVTDGLVNKLTVRLRGPETLIRSISPEKLTQSIDLSHIKKGKNPVPLAAEELGAAFRAFDIIDIKPPRIDIEADNLIERSVPLRTIIDSPLGGGALTVENVTVSPATVILRGPEKIVSTIANIPITIRLDPKAADRTVQQNITLDTPSLVTASPPSVRVNYTITSGRTVINRVCPVIIAEDGTHHYTVNPPEINLLVEVPEALAKNSTYLQQLKVSAVPQPCEINESRKVKLRIHMPDGMTLLNPANYEVTITRVSDENVKNKAIK